MTRDGSENNGVSRSVATFLSELRNIPTWYAPTERGSDTDSRLRILAEKLSTYHAAYKDLGISICGFLFLDEENRRVIYGFFQAARAGELASTWRAIDNYVIPYQRHGWGIKGEDVSDDTHMQYASAIDALFYIHRHHQNPFEANNSKTRKEGVIPEYLRDLPPAEDRCIVTLPVSSACLRTEFGLHYVPYGEMIAFQLAWRRLLQRIQLAIGPAWEDPNQWRSTIYERDWIAARLPSSSPSYLKSEAQNALAKILMEYEGPAGSASWYLALKYMLLIPDDSPELGQVPAQGFEPLQKFVRLLDPTIELRHDMSPEAFATLADALLANRLLCNVNTTENDPATLLHLLNTLHEKSRFPILPYFYWSAISRQPRSHCVIPIWASITFPIREPIFSPTVGMAVVDLRPLGELDTTCPATITGKCETLEDARTRIHNLRAALRLVAQPQVDAAFIARVVTTNAEVKAAHEILFPLAHDAKKPAGALLNVLKNKQLKLDSAARLIAVTDMAEALSRRLAGIGMLATLRSTQETKERLKLELDLPGTRFVPISDILGQELMEVLIRHGLADDAPSERLFRPHDMQVTSVLSNRSLRERYLAKAVTVKGNDLLVPVQLPAHANQSGATEAIMALGLRFIFSEIFDNFVKHESGRLNPPLQVEISSSESYATPGTFILKLRIGPLIQFVAPSDFSSYSGLLSLKSTAERLNVTLSERSFKDGRLKLPFWQETTDMMVEWTIENVYLRLPQ